MLIAYYTILYYTILYYTILYYTILYYTIHAIHTMLIVYYTNYIILYYTILYYTILYYTILYYTILYYTNIILSPRRRVRQDDVQHGEHAPAVGRAVRQGPPGHC